MSSQSQREDRTQQETTRAQYKGSARGFIVWLAGFCFFVCFCMYIICCLHLVKLENR